MLIRMSIRQMKRAPVRLIASFLVVVLVCAFLVIGVNLRQTAQDNIQLLTQEFDVMAIPTFQGSVDKTGNLTTDTRSNYQGYMTVPAVDFDLSQIENAAGVKDVLVHKQFGGYLKTDDRFSRYIYPLYDHYDVIVFTYTGTNPRRVEWFADTKKTLISAIELNWSAADMDQYPIYKTNIKGKGFKFYNHVDSHAINLWEEQLSDEIWPKNEAGERTMEIILQPGQRYIASGEWFLGLSITMDEEFIPESEELQAFYFKMDQGHAKRELRYERGGWYMTSQADAYQVSYPCIMPYTEDFWETDAGAYFREAAEIEKVNANALTILATEDLSLYRPFYNGGVYISDGRNFFAEDYEYGNKVCLVSRALAEFNGWEIGDKLDFSFFEAAYGFNGEASDVMSYYEPLVEVWNEETSAYELKIEDSFFDEGQFEIIGFYDGKVTKSPFMDDIQYDMEEGIDRTVVIVPKKSVQNQPEVPLSQYNTTILLDDEQTMYFMSDMEASGLLEQAKGQYQISFEIFDQGLGGIKQSLRQLDTVSRMTLYLACAAAVVVIVLLSALTVLQSRRQIATLRSLGVKKGQISAAVLSGMLLVCLLGAIVGGVLGYTLSDRVAEYILDTAQMDLADTTFSAMLAKEGVEQEELYAIAIQSQPKVAVFASAVVLLSLTVLCCILVLPEARKSPMLTLGAKE